MGASSGFTPRAVALLCRYPTRHDRPALFGVPVRGEGHQRRWFLHRCRKRSLHRCLSRPEGQHCDGARRRLAPHPGKTADKLQLPYFCARPHAPPAERAFGEVHAVAAVVGQLVAVAAGFSAGAGHANHRFVVHSPGGVLRGGFKLSFAFAPHGVTPSPSADT